MRQKRIKPVDLIQMLDLDERNELAAMLGMNSSESLDDENFQNQIIQFSATTLLSSILQIRRPFFSMIETVFAFLENQEISGRTTGKVLLLNEFDKEVSLNFNASLHKSVVSALSKRAISKHRETIEEGAENLEKIISAQIKKIKGCKVNVKSRKIDRRKLISAAIRNDSQSVYSNGFHGQTRIMFDRFDFKKINALTKDFRDFTELFKTAIQTKRNFKAFSPESILNRLERTRRQLKIKIGEMNCYNVRPGDFRESDLKREINENEWESLIESFRIFKEDLLANCDYEAETTELCDFLNLDIWQERWRIYELWTLVYLISIFERQGFEVDISSRIKNGKWDLKYAKDSKPIAVLSNGTVSLDVYYQLYSKGSSAGDMPDIAVKSGSDFLLIFDPKHGKTYPLGNLSEVARRYAALAEMNRTTTVSSLTVVHNFYSMHYEKEELDTVQRSLVMSGIRPNSPALAELEQEILSILPPDWKRPTESIIILIDVSPSMDTAKPLVIEKAGEVFSSHRLNANAGSAVMLFADGVICKKPFDHVEDFSQDFCSYTGNGTNLQSAISEAIDHLQRLPTPSRIFLFNDGDGLTDIEALTEKILAHEISLEVRSINSPGEDHLIKKLIDKVGGFFTDISLAQDS